jgi:hypothetical protein
MATVDDAAMVRGMLRNNGVYRDSGGEDPRPYVIAQYLNDYGKHAWSLCYSAAAFDSLLASPHCRDIVVLWTHMEGLTEDGDEFLTLEARRG